MPCSRVAPQCFSKSVLFREFTEGCARGERKFLFGGRGISQNGSMLDGRGTTLVRYEQEEWACQSVLVLGGLVWSLAVAS